MAPRFFFFITGKGGVGKTTVAAALARQVEHTGRRVLIATSEPNERLSRLLGTAKLDSEIRHVSTGIWALNIDPKTSIVEYGALTLGSRTASNALFGGAALQRFLAAVPGVYQWAVLGKVMFHASEREHGGTERFDAVILDAPATGHAVEMLRVPKSILDVAPPGMLRRDAERAWRKLQDPDFSSITLVTLPEPTPTDETLELNERIVQGGLRPNWLVVNRRLPALFRADDGRALERLEEGTRGGAGSQHETAEKRAGPSAVDVGRRRARQERIQAECVERLRRELPLRTTELPELPEVDDSAALGELGNALGGAFLG